VVLLFGVAFAAERLAARGRAGWLRSPLVYTLSLSIYCTGWTFYGAVGYAVRSGLEFVTIYLGPTLVMVGWWVVLRKLVQIARSQRITSVADLISARFGKSTLLGALVTLLAVIGTTPYIALQLQSVTFSFAAFAGSAGTSAMAENPGDPGEIALWVAAGLALFTIIFGTRAVDANERHEGIVTAIAVEAVVKLVALLAVGIFVVWGVAGGPAEMLARIERSPIQTIGIEPARWTMLIFLSAAAFLCLPRMFHVLVVETPDDRQLATAAWAFPLYLIAMSLFVIPIAVVGLELMPEGTNPDLFVLALPLALEREGLAVLAFLGGFSAATSMVIVATIALATMVSNHIVMPLWLATRSDGASMAGDLRRLLLLARRASIVAVLGLGYLYHKLSGGGEALAAIGLISFVGVAQALPALIGGIFWRGATRHGAAAGLCIGFAVWLYGLYLPSFGEGVAISARVMAEGPFGIGWLRPQALFGSGALDPLVHATFWSLALNCAAFVAVSLASFPRPLERLQGAQFVGVEGAARTPQGWSRGAAEPEDLLIMAQRILGPEEAQALFRRAAAEQGVSGYLPEPTPEFVETLERELAGSVGAATANAMIGNMVGGSAVSVEDLMAVADETAQIMEYSARLEAKSAELGRTARQLREANEKLTQLSIQKDAFLSQISHELRTPMTSIRAFSEILMAEENLPEGEKRRFSAIIHDETLRLTRLLDDLLDLSVLENGEVALNWQDVSLTEVLDRAEAAALPAGSGEPLLVERNRSEEQLILHTDSGRLAQIFINLISNARKYCAAEVPRLAIRVRQRGDEVLVDFVDNGPGIPREERETVFEKFARSEGGKAAAGAGLGLAICREVAARLGGTVAYLPGQGGGAFRVSLPVRARAAA
jgi:Na+/proline symporter/signal transduction histidine kinase